MTPKKPARYSKTALRKSSEPARQPVPEKVVGKAEQNWLLGGEPPRK
ncbi:MAG: hypothetical protein ABIT76_10485 [Chthoniobacterales bacterium]